MIGLSLSLCVAEIINDRVRLEDVELIRANTMARDDADWERVVNHYCLSYWRRDPDRARRVVRFLRDADRIHQHRVTGDALHQHAIHDGIWQERG